jgi:hypothetical protein
VLSNELVGRRRAVRAADGTGHRRRHAPVNRFNVKGVLLPARALDFYGKHIQDLFKASKETEVARGELRASPEHPV